MDDMQNQMNAILGNPEMMQKIMSMAQSLNQANTPPTIAETKENVNTSIPDIDLSVIQKLSGFAGQTNIDKNQRTLLNALSPYLSRDRLSKLEKAMRAAKMANLASIFLNKSGSHFNTGR